MLLYTVLFQFCAYQLEFRSQVTSLTARKTLAEYSSEQLNYNSQTPYRLSPASIAYSV